MWRNKLPTELLVEKPNYERLISTLWREDDVDRVPFYEHFVDLEVVEHLLGVKLRGMDLNKEENKVNYLKQLVKFYRGLRYDCVPFELPPKFPRDNVLLTKDTARLSPRA